MNCKHGWRDKRQTDKSIHRVGSYYFSAQFIIIITIILPILHPINIIIIETTAVTSFFLSSCARYICLCTASSCEHCICLYDTSRCELHTSSCVRYIYAIQWNTFDWNAIQWNVTECNRFQRFPAYCGSAVNHTSTNQELDWEEICSGRKHNVLQWNVMKYTTTTRDGDENKLMKKTCGLNYTLPDLLQT